MTADEYANREFAIREIAVGSELSDDLRDWMQALWLGFHGKVGSEARMQAWHRDLMRGPHRVRGSYRTGIAAALAGPVATLLSFDGRVNTGAGVAAANFITDVSVRGSHTRRGLMRELMLLDLTAARGRGVPFAALTATEATIYGRFGFGVSTRHTRIELDGSPGFALKVPTDDRLEVADPRHPDVVAALERLYGQLLETRRGAHSRGSFYREMLSGELDWETAEPNLKTRCVVHLDPDDRIDGVLVYEVSWDDHTLTVQDLQAASAPVELALWHYAARHDLMTKVTAHCVDLDSPLRWAMADPRRLSITDHKDHTYLRILDVAAALQLRGWEHDGQVAIAVDDSLDLTPGTWTVTVVDGAPTVTEGGKDPVTLNVSTLGSLYFGDVTVGTLADIGMVTGSAGAIEAAHRLFVVEQRPHSRSHF